MDGDCYVSIGYWIGLWIIDWGLLGEEGYPEVDNSIRVMDGDCFVSLRGW